MISRLSCSLKGLEQEVLIKPGTAAARAYGKAGATEKFLCSFGLNERYRKAILSHGLRAAGEDREGNLRIVELEAHPFFMATLFVPQLSSQPGAPHPLIRAFVEAATAHPARRRAVTRRAPDGGRPYTTRGTVGTWEAP